MGRAASQCSAPPDLLPSEARALLRPNTPTTPSLRVSPSQAYKPPQSPSTAVEHNEEKPRLRFEVKYIDNEYDIIESKQSIYGRGKSK